jgi:hypothetical protein
MVRRLVLGTSLARSSIDGVCCNSKARPPRSQASVFEKLPRAGVGRWFMLQIPYDRFNRSFSSWPLEGVPASLGPEAENHEWGQTEKARNEKFGAIFCHV